MVAEPLNNGQAMTLWERACSRRGNISDIDVICHAAFAIRFCTRLVHIGVAQIVMMQRYRSIVFSTRHPSLDFTESSN